VKVIHANLKTDEGQSTLRQALERTDILLTSFRPSALKKLGLFGGLIQLTLNGSANADANGNVSFCFVYTGDWS
jgi:hypothetical protein